MNDLRWDQEEADAATHGRLRMDPSAIDPRNVGTGYVSQYGPTYTVPLSTTIKSTPHVMPADALRTVAMPDLRRPAACQLDGETRDLRPFDVRAEERLARIEAAIERIADAVTVLMLERELRGTVPGQRKVNGYE